MKHYIIELQDKDINDDYISSLLFTSAVFKACSCKQLARRLSHILKSDDYELKYSKEMNKFVLKLVYDRKNRILVVTYHIAKVK